MIWIMEHSELLVIATVIVTLFAIFLVGIFTSSDVSEASDLQGFPETLGDFPPLDNWVPLTEDIYPDLSTEELEKILRGDDK